MRVLIIAQYFPPDMGGGATRAYNAAKGLASTSCSVTVIAAVPHYPYGKIPEIYRRKPLDIEYHGMLRVFRTFVPPLASAGLARRILLFVSFTISSLFALPFIGEVDVIWAANPNIIAFFPSLVYKLAKRCPVVQNVDDLWPESLYDLGTSRNSPIARLGELLARITYNLSSALTPISPGYVQTLLNKYQVDPRKIHVVPAGIDLDRFCSTTSDVLGKEEGTFTVLYIGAFSPAYDFDQVFNAARELGSQPDIRFVIQGGGELASVLKSKVQQMNLRNVTIIDKIVSREEVARRLAAANVLLLPLKGIGSIEMGISSKIYEYQASGKPIICCSSGQPERYVRETGSGIVTKPGDHMRLAESISYLRQNAAVGRKFGEAGRQYVEKNLSAEKIGLRLKNIFGSLADKHAHVEVSK